MSRVRNAYRSPLPSDAAPLAADPQGVDPSADARLVRLCRQAGGFPRAERLPSGGVALVYPWGRPA